MCAQVDLALESEHTRQVEPSGEYTLGQLLQQAFSKGAVDQKDMMIFQSMILEAQLGKRAHSGSPSPNKFLGHFSLPKDLTIHLARTQAVPCSPLILPHSQLHFGLWVKYRRLFPYEEQAIIDLAQVVMQPASFIDFHPFKGYFDLVFTFKADAATWATSNSWGCPLTSPRNHSKRKFPSLTTSSDPVRSLLQQPPTLNHPCLCGFTAPLPALRIKAEATISKYIGDLLLYNNFLKQPLVTNLAPHIADHPTPLLSSLVCALTDEEHETENEPPNPPSPSAMVG
ncbi:hypothetical protein L0F63_003979 [Massospora cicadina]|nr:hypothetical protein L0F63_003979 [Massospora cicadina]